MQEVLEVDELWVVLRVYDTYRGGQWRSLPQIYGTYSTRGEARKAVNRMRKRSIKAGWHSKWAYRRIQLNKRLANGERIGLIDKDLM